MHCTDHRACAFLAKPSTTRQVDTEKAGRDRVANLGTVRARWAKLCNEWLHEFGRQARATLKQRSARQGGPSSPGRNRGRDDPDR